MNNSSLPEQNLPLRTNRRSWLKAALLTISGASTLGCWQLAARGPTGRCNSFHSDVFSQTSGEWGNLEYERLVLEPDENILDLARLQKPTRWFFKGYSLDQLTAFFKSAGVADKKAVSQGQIAVQKDGIAFTPRREFILSLTPESRQKIYAALMANPDYSRNFDVFLFVREYLDLTLQETTLSAETLRMFRSLLYKQGNLMAFSDAPVVLSTLTDAAAKTAFLKMLVRRPALTVRLKLDNLVKSTALLNYWSVHQRTWEVQSVLQRPVPGGIVPTIDVVELLPSWVRGRINTFPSPADKQESVRNCHWTALNFFNDQPNDGFLFIESVEKELTTNFSKVGSAPQLGDVVLFRNTAHEIVHSAVFIADNVVFTKNGEGAAQPWCFMKVTDLIDLYTSIMGTMSVKVYRRNVV